MIILKEFKNTSKGIELNAVETEDLLNFFGFGGWNGYDTLVTGTALNDNGEKILSNPNKWEKHNVHMGWAFNLRIDGKDLYQGFAKGFKSTVIKLTGNKVGLKLERDNKFLIIDINATQQGIKNFLELRNK